jgi:hypothetical protein
MEWTELSKKVSAFMYLVLLLECLEQIGFSHSIVRLGTWWLASNRKEAEAA